MHRLLLLVAFSYLACPARAAEPGGAPSSTGVIGAPLDFLTRPQTYVLKRWSSYDKSGGNADYRTIAAGDSLTLVDADGPATITHLWATVACADPGHLKSLALRMYWDDEETPSVEVPLGDFFGLGLGDYAPYSSIPLTVAHDRALNAFFPMPFREHAKIVVTNEGSKPVTAFYFNIEGRAAPLSKDTLYFHAQYRQATPAAVAGDGKNVSGKDNYVWLEAAGRGHFVGVTMSVVENADGWWGEGDDMFFVDGENDPSIHGTGAEDYFLGAWDFGGKAFSSASFGAPVVGAERAGAAWSLYRFHLDSPIPFTRSLRATIEHGHANNRGDAYSSVAYWYQTEPHAPFPPLPAAAARLLRGKR